MTKLEEAHATLTRLERENNIELSPYGYIMWALDNYGWQCGYSNMLTSEGVVKGYCAAAIKYRDDMPEMLLNANDYFSRVMNNVADTEAALKHLEGMSTPYILYVLLAPYYAEMADRYREAAEEQLKRYPSTLDKLTGSYKRLKEVLLHADAK